jgi:hypothetical protein
MRIRYQGDGEPLAMRPGAQERILWYEDEAAKEETVQWMEKNFNRLNIIMPYTSVYRETINFARITDNQDWRHYPVDVLERLWPDAKLPENMLA